MVVVVVVVVVGSDDVVVVGQSGHGSGVVVVVVVVEVVVGGSIVVEVVVVGELPQVSVVTAQVLVASVHVQTQEPVQFPSFGSGVVGNGSNVVVVPAGSAVVVVVGSCAASKLVSTTNPIPTASEPLTISPTLYVRPEML